MGAGHYQPVIRCAPTGAPRITPDVRHVASTFWFETQGFGEKAAKEHLFTSSPMAAVAAGCKIAGNVQRPAGLVRPISEGRRVSVRPAAFGRTCCGLAGANGEPNGE